MKNAAMKICLILAMILMCCFAGAESESDEPAAAVYVAESGAYYHLNAECSGLENVQMLNFYAVFGEMQPCPDCLPVEKTAVWYAEDGDIFHYSEFCSGMTEAVSSTWTEAAMIGKMPCTVCWSDSTVLWAMGRGKYCHIDEHCSDMMTAESIRPLEAAANNRKCCHNCFEEMAELEAEQVWFVEGDLLYHCDEDCEGMENPQTSSAAQAVRDGRRECTVCYVPKTYVVLGHEYTEQELADIYVWAISSDSEYHVAQFCGDLTYAEQITLLEAIEDGKTHCRVCIGEYE